MTTRWRVGWILPRLMLVVMGTDVAARCVPLELFAIRPNEALQPRNAAPEGPFEPNREFHNARSYGDLSAIGNLPRRRVYRRVDFTTDEFGFHNVAGSGGDTPAAGILFGDSFAIGAEVPEEKTLAAQLTEEFSASIYNAGGYVPLDLGRVRQLANRLKLRKGMLIYEFHEAHLKEIPPSDAAEGSSWRHRVALRILGFRGSYRLRGWLSLLTDSRLQLLAQRFERAMENNSVLPNSFASNVVEGRLRNHDWMLFLPSRIEPVDLPDAAVARWANFFSYVSNQISRDGLELVVLIVPSKFTVYGPLLESPRLHAEGDVLLGQLERRLRDRGVRVVNASPAFRKAATELAERHQYIYWQDDTHWNECAVTLAVEEFRKQMSSQAVPKFAVAAHPPPAGRAWRAALPPDCQSQQKYAATSLSSR